MYEIGKKLACQLMDSKIWYIGKVAKIKIPYVFIDVDCDGGEAVFNLTGDSIHQVQQLRSISHVR